MGYLPRILRTRHTQLLAERERFSHALDALPHTFGHLDAQYRNVLLCEGATGQRDVVLIDWADCGIAPLGAELNALICTSSLVFGWPPTQVRELDQRIFASYLDGLAASGWTGNARQVRLSYVGCAPCIMAVYFLDFSDTGVGQTTGRLHCSSSVWQKKSCTCSGSLS